MSMAHEFTFEKLPMERRMSKDKIKRFFKGPSGKLYGLWGCCTEAVGLFEITKELTHDYKGYLCKCSHEYWKGEHFKEVAE